MAIISFLDGRVKRLNKFRSLLIELNSTIRKCNQSRKDFAEVFRDLLMNLRTRIKQEPLVLNMKDGNLCKVADVNQKELIRLMKDHSINLAVLKRILLELDRILDKIEDDFNENVKIKNKLTDLSEGNNYLKHAIKAYGKLRKKALKDRYFDTKKIEKDFNTWARLLINSEKSYIKFHNTDLISSFENQVMDSTISISREIQGFSEAESRIKETNKKLTELRENIKQIEKNIRSTKGEPTAQTKLLGNLKREEKSLEDSKRIYKEKAGTYYRGLNVLRGIMMLSQHEKAKIIKMESYGLANIA